ncbi:MAG: tetratricopeptide repeat protein, partial [Cyclobacteriaceae bacterium]
MARKRRSIGQKVDGSNRKVFVGRKAELEAFKDNCKLGPEEDAFVNIYSIHGQGGIGKSKLLKEYTRISKAADYLTATIDAENKDLYDVPALMHYIAGEFGRQGHAFDQFNKKYQTYLTKKHELETNTDRPKGLWGKLVKGGIKAGARVGAEFVPGAGIILGTGMVDTLANASEEAINFITRHTNSPEERELMLNPVKILSLVWVKDLYDLFNKDHNIALIIDTYEAANPEWDQWLIALLKEEYGAFPAVLLVIGGRHFLDIERWQSFANIAHRMELDPFTEEEARSYLFQKGIKKEEIIQSIMDISGNLPVHLSLLVEGDVSDADNLSAPNEKVVAHFLKHLKNPVQRQLALHASLADSIDKDVVECLLPEEKGDELTDYFDWLKSRPFVQKRGGKWAYHPIVKDAMLRHLREVSEKDWDRLHQVLADYYKERAAKREVEGDRETWFEDDQWKELQFQRYFHLLCINYKKYIPDVIRDVALLLYNRMPSDIYQLSTVVYRTEEVLGIPSTWGQTLTLGMEELLNGDTNNQTNEQVPVMLENICNSGYIKNDQHLSHLYLLRGEVSSDEDETVTFLDQAIALDKGNYQAHFTMGTSYGMKGDYDLAIASFEAASALKPDFPEAHYNKGVTYGMKGDYNLAITSFDAALALKPDYLDAHFNKGIAYAGKDDFDLAIEIFDEVLALKPDFPEAHYGKGVSYSKKGAFDLAIASYDAALALKPDYPDAHYYKGFAYAEKGEYELAIASFDAALALKPDYPEAHFDKGVAYGSKGDFDMAIESYDVALALKSDYPDAHFNKGDAYGDKGEYDLAIASYDAALALKSDYPKAHYGKGVTYNKKSDFDLAIASFDAALALKRDFPEAQFHKGVAYVSKGDFDLSISSFDAALALKRDFPEAQFYKGVSYSKKGEYDLAISSFDAALALKPDYPDAHFNKGVSYSKKGEYDLAIASFDAVLALKPDYPDAHFGKGVVCNDKGEYDLAIASFDAALALRPDYPEAHYNKGVTYGKKYNFDLAIASYDAALAL